MWRPDVLPALMLLVLLGLGTPAPARAQPATAQIAQVQLERSAEGWLLSAAIRFDLPPAVEDALNKGIPLIFVADVDVYRERWYWTNKRVVTAQRQVRLSFQPLTRRWRTQVLHGNAGDGSGASLMQIHDTLADALAAVQRIVRWPVASAADIDPGQRHLLELRFRLDVSQLPRPLQIGTLGDSEWDLSASISRTLPAEVLR